MGDPLRVVLSGPGLIGKKHASLLDENPETSLVAIVAPDHDHNDAFARKHGVPRFSTLESAIEHCAVDAAIISSPNHAHFEQGMTCISAGIPVLIEKPLTDSLETAAQLVASADAHNVAVLVGHHRTYSPLLEVAKHYLSSEAFGTPVCVQGSALFYKPEDYFEAGAWRTRKGGGAILINLIHEVGILRLLFGEINSVTAHVSSAARGFEVEDTAAVTFGFRNGALGTFLLSDASASSKSWEMTAGENPAYPFFPDQDCYHFAGTAGSLDFPSMRVRTYANAARRSWWSAFAEDRLDVARLDPLARQLQHFVEVARGLAPPIVSARDGYLNMMVVEAIKCAAESGRQVRIAEFTS